ncbi:MAG: TonB-dependent receptor domain-containing protein, partial [Blastocatellia bacterium]
TIELQQFKKAEITGVDVTVGKDTVIDAQLEAGAISEVVTVVGGAEALVEKDTDQISTTFEQRKVQELPVNVPGRGLDRIALLAPGVTMGFGNVNANGVLLSANGQRARSNNFTIDGVDNNDLTIGGPNYFVRNPEVVGEFQIVTNNFSAEYGRNQGAIINIVSRPGSNEFHGSGGWDHLDNKLFNSLTNIERRRGDKNPQPGLDNIFTYSAGGPVIRNKIFFFTTGYFRRNPFIADLASSTYAPTPEGVQQLKSAFPNNAAVQYYADYSAFSLPLGNPQIRTDVPQSTITIGSVTVPVAAVRRLIPLANRQDEYTARGDANLTERHRLWGRYFWQNAPNVNLGVGFAGVGVNGWGFDQPALSKQIGGGWNWTVTTRLNNEFRFNYSKLFTIFGGGAAGGKGQVPHPDDIDKAFALLNPGFTAANGRGLLAVGPPNNFPQGRLVEAYQFTDNVAMTSGNHQFKFGADIRKLDNTAPFLPNVNGVFRFANGQQLADNRPTSLTVALGPSTLVYGETDQFYYFQDDWRIRPDLTLNLGVRYENTGQPINLLNDVTVARENDPKQAFWRQGVPIEGRVTPRIPTDSNNWAPRVGLVWSPRFENGFLATVFGKDKSTIRAGFGVAYDASFYNLLLNISTAAPIVFLTTVPGFGVPNAQPTGDKVSAAALASGLIAFNQQDPRLLNRTTINPDMHSPYTQQWSFGIQREINNSNVFEIRYVGSRGVGQFQTINANPFIGNIVNGFRRTYFDPAANTARTIDFPAFGKNQVAGATPLTCADNPATPLDDEGACNGRIHPSGVARERINGAYSSYHGLQLRYDGRFSRQVVYGFSYTFSKSIDNSSEIFNFAGGNSVAVAQNPLNLTRDERALSGNHIPHSFTMNFLWTLPFMKEQKGVIGKIAGGWQLNGTGRVQSGRLFTPTHRLPTLNPYEDAIFMDAFFGNSSHFRPFSGNTKAPLGSVAITDVDACIFYGLCGTQGANPILRTSPTGYFLMADLNRRDAQNNRIFTPVTPNDV